MGVRVKERPPGSGVWWVFVQKHGKRKAKRVGAENAAREAAEKIQARLTLDEFKFGKKEVNSCPTFKDHAEMWLALPNDDWKESTRETYRNNLQLHVYPVLGKCRLNEIKRKDLKAFLDGLLIKGLKSATVKLIRASISGVLTHAVDSELIESNPLRDLKVKNRSKALEDVEPLTEEEANSLLETVRKHQGGTYYPPILCGLRTGLRLGELQALQWGDIDFAGRFIEVKRSWRRERLTDPKSKKRRRVDMTSHLAETLRALRLDQKKRALKEGRPASEWVFDNGKGEMLNRETFKKALDKCLELAHLRHIRIHDLRHTYATIRLLRGHNVGDVSYQLGHSSIKITYDVYAHWIPGKFKSEVEELEYPQPNATQAQPTPPASRVL